VCTVSWGVVERYILKVGSGWPDELARYICTWAMMIGAGLCVARGAHIGVEAFVNMLPERLQRPLEFIGYILCCVFTICLSYVGFQYFGRLLRTMQLTPTIEFPIAYAYLAIPIGGVLMTVHYLIKVAAFREERQEKREAKAGA
ncbi:MAG: TRAP transporter small permease, partial [Deltaproteobacteria bacterium]|nr:TRAP transporter small permease [Deltaproteobacteria bacterium]